MARGRALVAPAVVALGLLIAGPRPAWADHESVGIVVWVGEGEVMPLTEGAFHVLEVTPRTVLVDEAGRPTRTLALGDRVRERCAPAPDGGSAAVRVEILRPAWQGVEASEL